MEKDLTTKNPSYAAVRSSHPLAGKIESMSVATSLVFPLVVSILVSLDSYYTMLPLFSDPDKDENNKYIMPEAGDAKGLFAYKDDTTLQESSLYRSGSGMILVISLALTIFGVSALAGLVVQGRMESLAISLFTAFGLGYIFGIFAKVVVDISHFWMIIWTLVFVGVAVAIAGWSIWYFFFKKNVDDETKRFIAERRTIVIACAAAAGVGLIGLAFEHISMISAVGTFNTETTS